MNSMSWSIKVTGWQWEELLVHSVAGEEFKGHRVTEEELISLRIVGVGAYRSQGGRGRSF